MNDTKLTGPPQIGEIYLMTFDGIGSEQSGIRPGLVFQNNVGNAFSPNIIALPLTSASKKPGQPTHVYLSAKDTGLRLDSIVLCENPERMSKERIGRYLTRLSNDDMRRVAEASLLATASLSFLSSESLVRLWEAAVALNSKRGLGAQQNPEK